MYYNNFIKYEISKKLNICFLKNFKSFFVDSNCDHEYKKIFKEQ